MNCLGVNSRTLQTHNLTSEAVARELALGAARCSAANVSISNTGVSDSTDAEIPEGAQCCACVFKAGAAHAAPAIYSETVRFSSGRNAVRRSSAEYALTRLTKFHEQWRAVSG